MKPEKKKEMRKAAAAEIMEIFKNAEASFAKKPEYSRKMIKKMRRLAMHYKLKLPLQAKRRFCKQCNSVLFPGRNCRVRLRKGMLVMLCLECKSIKRVGYKRR